MKTKEFQESVKRVLEKLGIRNKVPMLEEDFQLPEKRLARLLNVLREPTYVESGDLQNALVLYAKPNLRSHVLVGFDIGKILMNQLYIHKKTKLDIQNQNAAHVARFVQLGSPTGHTIMFDALAAPLDD
uniref:Uncharacterized protein n=1 Tax=Romanomermis culicivorax TaxID=13658 RepID=A0A915HVJ7_ROMCU